MEKIGRFRILRRLGGGGFGEVWLGHDDIIDRDVAVKVFKPKDENLIAFATSSDSEGLDILRTRFINEARILGSLEGNPFVINVLDFGELPDGDPYYVMPYLPHSLTDKLGKDIYDAAAIEELSEQDRPRSLSVSDSLRIIEQLLQGLAAAHARDLVHRDIKPSNIMLTDEGEVRLVDFGIAKAPDGQHSTVSQLGMGSRNYMAPEQRESAKHVDARADIYAVGAVGYRMITGRLPSGRYSDPNVHAPALNQGINDLIVSCLAENKDDRPATAGKLLDALRDAMANQGTDTEETGTWVAGGASTLRDELKPLKEEIGGILAEHVEITDADLIRLRAMAAVVDLDEAGLAALIKTIEEEQGQSLQLKRNFLNLVDSSITEGGTTDTEMLYKAARPTGMDRDQVDTLIKKKTQAREPEPGKHRSAPKQARKGPAIAVVVLIALSALGYFGYEQYEAYNANIIADEAAFRTATQTGSIEAYENYLANWVDGKNRELAESELKRLRELQATAATQQESLITQTQRMLTRLGYKVNINGEPDIRTEKAIEEFEQSQSLSVTGSVDQLLVEALQEEINRRDEAAWRVAQKSDTEASYLAYQNEYPQGLHIDKISAAIGRATDRAAWRSASSRNTGEAYSQYLASYPSGERASEARSRRTDLENRATAAAEAKRLEAEAQAARERLVSDIQTELERLNLLTGNYNRSSLDDTTSNAIKMFEAELSMGLTGKATDKLLTKLQSTEPSQLRRVVGSVARYFQDSGRVWILPSPGETIKLGETLYGKSSNGTINLRISGRSGKNYVAYSDNNQSIPVSTNLYRSQSSASADSSGAAATSEDYNPTPIVVVQPVYPSRALSRGLSGSCTVGFTVTSAGSTSNHKIMNCSNSLFEQPSIRAAQKFKYKPRVENGTAIATQGVEYEFNYRLQ